MRPGIKQRIYRLGRVVTPASTSGELRAARAGDLTLLAGWLDAFIEETGVSNPQTGLQLAEAGIVEGRIFVWDDGGPVSTAMWTRPTPNGVTINGVYSRGLGAAAVTHRRA